MCFMVYTLEALQFLTNVQESLTNFLFTLEWNLACNDFAEREIAPSLLDKLVLNLIQQLAKP